MLLWAQSCIRASEGIKDELCDEMGYVETESVGIFGHGDAVVGQLCVCAHLVKASGWM